MPAHLPVKMASRLPTGEQKKDYGMPQMSILELATLSRSLSTLKNLDMKKYECGWEKVKGGWDQYREGGRKKRKLKKKKACDLGEKELSKQKAKHPNGYVFRKVL